MQGGACVDKSGRVTKLLRERGTKVTDLQLCQKLHKQERWTPVFGRDQLRCSQEEQNSTPSRQPSGEHSLERPASSLPVLSAGSAEQAASLTKSS